MDGYDGLMSGQRTVCRILCLSALLLTAVSAAVWLLFLRDSGDPSLLVFSSVVSVFLLCMAGYAAYRRSRVALARDSRRRGGSE